MAYFKNALYILKSPVDASLNKTTLEKFQNWFLFILGALL